MSKQSPLQEPSAHHGLLVLACVAAFVTAVSSLDAALSDLSPESHLPTGRCLYQVVRDGVSLGITAFDCPSTVPEVLGAFGVDQGLGGDTSAVTRVPCARTIKVVHRSFAYQLETLKGRALLCVGRRINVNEADADDLCAVPGIGPSLAERIVVYRDEHGPFRTISELRAIQGMGPKRMATLEVLLQVGSGDCAEVRQQENDKERQENPTTKAPKNQRSVLFVPSWLNSLILF